jgi:hypothetical protein
LGVEELGEKLPLFTRLPRGRVLGNYYAGAFAHILFQDTENWAFSL